LSDLGLYHLKYNQLLNSIEPALISFGRKESLALDFNTEITLNENVIPTISSIEQLEFLIQSNSPTSNLSIPISSFDQIIERAESILNTSWELSKLNYSAIRENSCDSPDNIWLRPKSLNNESKIGEIISSPPYKWGGHASINVFEKEISNGSTAGDICTCRCRKDSCTLEDWCIDESTAGFDCSGFVSNAWDTRYRSTVTLPKLGIPVRWNDLKPGDILNNPGKHVMLFVSFVDKYESKLQVIESSIECGGVCKNTYSRAELIGYSPLRHPNLSQ